MINFLRDCSTDFMKRSTAMNKKLRFSIEFSFFPLELLSFFGVNSEGSFRVYFIV